MGKNYVQKTEPHELGKTEIQTSSNLEELEPGLRG